MRIYIIGDDGITLCREPPATVNKGEVAVASREELHAARLSGKRLLALWNIPDAGGRFRRPPPGAAASARCQEGQIRPRPELKPGTRLVREWQGRTYDVLVLDDGFSWRGTGYRSLSAVAGKITGTAWSGPLFFGLKPNRTAALRPSRGPRSAGEDGDAAS